MMSPDYTSAPITQAEPVRPEHQTVLLREAVDALAIQPEGRYVDGTFGRGGHSQLLLGRLDQQAGLLLMDRDPQAVAVANKLFGNDERVTVIHAPFSELKQHLQTQGWFGKVDGILLDLGVSSPQLDQADRGFSFQTDGALDMRMDTSQGESAAEWLAHVDESELIFVLKRYGEEKFAKRIARGIVAARAESPITTTLQLVDIITEAMPFIDHHKHPATRSFQAIRIAVNDELGEIERVLPDAFDALAVGGRLVVISFHSLEDRRVKRFMQREAKADPFPPDLPIRADQIQPRLKIIGKPMRAGQDETEHNRRSRSAIMRVAERLR